MFPKCWWTSGGRAARCALMIGGCSSGQPPLVAGIAELAGAANRAQRERGGRRQGAAGGSACSCNLQRGGVRDFPNVAQEKEAAEGAESCQIACRRLAGSCANSDSTSRM